MATTSTGPRYAPEDPTLPKPWRGLVDGSTGYLYFWNPETNVTQYERPGALPPPPPPGPPPPSTLKLAPVSLSSSVHTQHSESSGNGKHVGSHGQQIGDSSNHGQRHGSGHSVGMKSNEGYNHHYNGSGDVGRGQQPKLAPIPSARSQQVAKSDSGHMQNGPTPHVNGSHGQSYSNSQPFRSSGRAHGLDSGNMVSSDAYRRQHEITITGDNIPPPLTTFESTGFPSEILREVHNAGFASPTPIQAQTWPIALQSRDIVAIAKTGSGKTLGYLIPGFIHLKQRANNPRMGPTVLVLSPTRELATQIQEEAVKFGKSSRISCACLYGGAPKGPQLKDLDRGVDIVVATPGRLNDILEMRRVSLRQVSYLVLDEADRMLDMGFEPQIRKIVNEIPPRRQTLMYTATWPKEVRKIAADLLVHPVQVNIGNIDELVANKAITQYVEVVAPMEKQRRLEQILRSQEPGSKVIVFCSTKRMCDQLARSIPRQFNAAAIHGDKSQGERDWVLNQFRTGKSPILVATDVAARGLDIKDIRVVINYDFPTGVEDYVHRIGRTGRAGATGVSYTFFSDQDAKYAGELVKVLEGANQKVPQQLRDIAMHSVGLPKGRNRWDYGSGRSGGGGARGHGASRSDVSAFGARGGRGPSSGRSERGHGRDNGHGRGYDRPHVEGWRGVGSDKDRGHSYGNSRSKSRSRSRSPNRGKGWEWGFSYGDSPRRSRSKARSRSRSRSRSGDRCGMRHRGRSPAAHRDSPPPHRSTDSPEHNRRSPYREEDVWRPSPRADNDTGRQAPNLGIESGGGANGHTYSDYEEGMIEEAGELPGSPRDTAVEDGGIRD